MNVREALRRINFKIGTPDDISGKAVNPFIDNRYIIDELNTQMRQYANITKGIHDIYSFPLQQNTPIVEAPSLALRSESYFFCYLIQRGTIFPMDMRAPNDVYPIFRVEMIKGICNWVMPFSNGKTKYLSFFPAGSVTPTATTLSAAITATETTIPVTSTVGYIKARGRITIGTEKIMYEYTDATNFYGCTRGMEMTTAAHHAISTTVTENNVFLFYARMPETIIVTDDNFVDESVLAHEIEIVEEHVEGIIKATAYNLLLKVDPERAVAYKADYDALFDQYGKDIRKGYAKNRMGTNIRNPYVTFESGLPFGMNTIY